MQNLHKRYVIKFKSSDPTGNKKNREIKLKISAEAEEREGKMEVLMDLLIEPSLCRS
jgi:hypothetical protein